LVLLVYGMWQDSHMEVKFTDVDYFVFSDAAEFVSLGQSPYLRATYRYSPLLAWILLPNITLTPIWGKLIFIIADFATAYLMHSILTLQNVSKSLISFSLFVWLFNPLTATVSCRGNAESILAFLVCCTVYLLFKKQTFAAGIIFGLAVHLKIYPMVYALYFIFNLKTLSFKPLLFKLFSYERVKFVFAFFMSVIGLTILMYAIYGFPFLQHTYLYHITRTDVRHNFSVYFYMLYIDPNGFHGLMTFCNQAIVITVLSYTHYEDLPFCIFLLTYVFVTFNKVCTSQYFIWYISILPLVAPKLSHISLRQCGLITFLWFLGQGFWLSIAYLLEFNGQNVFLVLWIAVLGFFIVNVHILNLLIKQYKFTSTYTKNVKLNLNIIKAI
uniref:GPI alpha-1,4-mannosyltransferase I, catalytic subunit n=1 Tax=Ciona savignyi TaxID=51511 RepID=H2YHC0_CIOSA